MKKKAIKAAALGLAASLMFTGCGSTPETEEEQFLEEVIEESELEEEEVLDEEVEEDNKAIDVNLAEVCGSIDDYDLVDEHNFTGISVHNPMTDEDSKHIFSCVVSFAMGSEKFGDLTDFKESAKEIAYGVLSLEQVEDANIVIANYYYESLLDENVGLLEKRVFYEFSEAGIKKVVTVCESQFWDISKDVYLVNRNIKTDDKSYSMAVFYQGDEHVADIYESPLLETFAIPMGLYTKEDLIKLQEELNKVEVEEKSLTKEPEE